MQLNTLLATIIAFAATTQAQARSVSTSVMTLSWEGLTLTLPDGISQSTTQTEPGWTVTGTATIVNDVAVITSDSTVYMQDLDDGSTVSGNVDGENDLNDVTVINGVIQGVDATSTGSASGSSSTNGASTTGTASGTSSVTASGTASVPASGTTSVTASGTASSASASSSNGAAQRGSGKGLVGLVAGLGAAAVAVAM